MNLPRDPEKVCQRYGKVKAQIKDEMKQVESSLNLDLKLALFAAAACQNRRLNILPGILPLLQTPRPLDVRCARIVF